ncbi:aldose 1-epimerase [Paenibacillus sp. GCM10027627]|uniref:aldose 1-epimerase n=1 Tax=unclassified Paenibacillus TaxID=185978 RepID=UPI0036339CA7
MTAQRQAAYEGSFYDERAVWLQWGSYEAAMLPKLGANLIAFRDLDRGISMLREPSAKGMDDLRLNPVVYGIPVLFPPNRYEDGTFNWNGRTYAFPINEPHTGNHIHGFLHSSEWEVEQYGVLEHESFAVMNITIDETHPIYAYFPHRFTIKLRYSLSAKGLAQHVTVQNEGQEAMPCLLGFHTTINAPFVPGSGPEHCRFTLTMDKRWELNDRMLPTGRTVPLSPDEQAMRTEGISPFRSPLDHHYKSAALDGHNRMVLTDTRTGIELVYEAGAAYRQWMIWNNGGTPGFICPEPQINMVNAPNVALPPEETGLLSLAPGELWEETSRLFLRQTN